MRVLRNVLWLSSSLTGNQFAVNLFEVSTNVNRANHADNRTAADGLY